MTSRNIKIPSKKLFFLNIALSLIICSSMANAGLIELYHLKTTDGKSIILLGDDHSVYNSREIMNMVDLIKEQEQKEKSITLLVEQALDNEHTISFSSSMLVSLSKSLEESPLEKTEVKNIEVRTISNAVLSLLDDSGLDYLTDESFFQNGYFAPKIMVNNITFQQVYDEYNHLKEKLSMQYKKYDDVCIQQLFEQQVDTASQHYEQLQYVFNKWKNKYGVNENEAVVNLIKNLRRADLVKRTQNVDDDKERLTLSEKLMVYILRVFIPLFNINAFDHIMQQRISSDAVLFVAGYSHADVMKDWLVSCDETLVQSIVNSDNVDFHMLSNDIITQLSDIL